MNKEKLLEVKGNHYYNYSDEAQQALDDLIERAIDDGGLEDFYDAYWETTDDTFMYCSDAFDYVKNYGDYDFKEPVAEGFTNIYQIAAYNLEQEFFDLLRKTGLTPEDFEGPDTNGYEEDEEEDEE